MRSKDSLNHYFTKTRNPIMRKIGYLLIGFCLFNTLLSAQKTGHHIEVKIDGLESESLSLGYYLMDKQYLLDTAYVDNDGLYVFQGEEPLAAGMYLIVIPPDNRFFQIMVNENEQHFSLYSQNPQSPSDDLQIEGSKDNQLFYDYLAFLEVKRPLADQLKKDIEAAEDKPNKKTKLEAELDALNQAVESYQRNIIEQNPETLTAAIIKANMALPDMPEFEGTEDDIRFQQWQYSKGHFFDNIDLGDPKMLRSPFLYQRVNHYIQNLTSSHPDSINRSLDVVLEGMKPAPETFKYYLVHFLNEYAKSKVVGYDAMYVHLVDKYYSTGLAPWTDEEQLEKIIDNARRLKPLLIGKIAPNIKMQTQEQKEIWLHDFDAPITVLFFWDPDCGHCKKSMPDMVDFYKAYKDKGVEVFAVCTKLYNELDSCWSYIDEKGIGIWLNTVDPYHRSKYKTLYDIRSTPQIYILDEKKEILSKRIGAEQLPEVMDRILEIRENKIKIEQEDGK